GLRALERHHRGDGAAGLERHGVPDAAVRLRTAVAVRRFPRHRRADAHKDRRRPRGASGGAEPLLRPGLDRADAQPSSLSEWSFGRFWLPGLKWRFWKALVRCLAVEAAGGRGWR